MLNINQTNYDKEIERMILANLDGWSIKQDHTNYNDDVEPFMTTDEITEKANKIITKEECESAYEEALDTAYITTNRLNIDDLNNIETRMFLRAVCKLTASNLWNKYNIRVTNENLEDTYIQSYGGLLYKSAMNALKPFTNQRITGLNTGD